MTNYCGRLDPHPSHTWGNHRRDDGHYTTRPADHLCPGAPLIEGGAECTLHQAPLAHCRCREEQRARWAS